MQFQYTPHHLGFFWSRVHLVNGCWRFNGSLRPDGYGFLGIQRRPVLAHRFAFYLAFGEFPDDAIICHTCDNRSCVRTDEVGTYMVDGVEYHRRGHLWLGTYTANAMDMVAKGRSNKGRRLMPVPHPIVPTYRPPRSLPPSPQTLAARLRYGQKPPSIFYRQSDRRWVATIELAREADGKRRRYSLYGRTEADVLAKLDTYQATPHP